jgi:hypothetical protein
MAIACRLAFLCPEANSWQPCDRLVVESDRLVGMRFRRTRMEGGKPVGTDDTYERRGGYVISSIGSIPEAIPGIDMKGELFAFTDWDLGRLAKYPNVFPCVGLPASFRPLSAQSTDVRFSPK